MVATTTQVADLVRQVGGDRVSVDGMLRPGGDPHDYEPRPSDVAAVARADLVFRSGGEVDGWLGDVIDDAGGNAQVVSLIDSVDRIGDDPHWWQDPRNAERAVETIRARLTKLDPGGRRAYRRNAARLERRLRTLDARIAGCVARVPAAKRRIVTTHDALGYFARRYGVDVVGAVIPSLSTQAQASAGRRAEARGPDSPRARGGRLPGELGQPRYRARDRPRGGRERRGQAVRGLARAEGERGGDLRGCALGGRRRARARACRAGG